jgi:O-antigen ligase
MFYNSNKYSQINLFNYLIYFFPFLLISGPALGDITISIIALTYLFRVLLFKLDFNNDDVFKFFFIFLIFAVCSSLYNYINSNILIDDLVKSLLLIRFPIFYLAVVYWLKPNIRIIAISASIASLVLCLDILYQYIFGHNILGFTDIYNGNRLQGLFNDEYIAGSYLVKIFILNFFLLSTISKYLRVLFYIVFTFFIIIIGERAALVQIFIFIFFTETFYFENKFKINFIFIIPILAIIFFSTINFLSFQSHLLKPLKYLDDESITNHILYEKDIFDRNINNSFKNRIYRFDNNWLPHYASAIGMFMDSPIMGKGYRGFRNNCDKYSYEFILHNKTRCSTHPHQIYIQLISEFGLMGLLLFMLFIYKSINSFYNRNVKLKLILTLFIFFIPFFTPTGNLFTNWMFSLFWYIFVFLKLENDQ